jgi:diguanylate cyclase (GGDEF)-like protein
VARAARASAGGASPTAPSTFEFVVGRGKDQKAFEARLRPQPDGTLLIVMRDTTERRRAKARIEYLAYYDVLTGLPNRQLFVREVGRAISSAKESGRLIALLYLDLDRFKRINDNLGHSVGDALLKNVARRLEQSARPADLTTPPPEGQQHGRSRVARLGGDEFVVLLTGLTDEAQTAALANRIRQSLGEPLDCGGHRLVVTPSIGIALYPQDGTDIEDLLVKADMAMYQAKDQGRNGCAFYGHSMAVRSLGRLELENDLRSAFQSGDFQIYYQPKVELASGMIIGVEALLRWQHATRGWIAPDIFIPVAEETGLIAELGDWVIRQACKQLNTWAAEGLGHLTIAVNVSVQQFARADFVESVLRALWQYGVKPELLELEITESLLMRNVDDTTACMKRFRAAGVTLSIDDFGTGYSSLGYLRQFPVDALKIDRSFVKDLHTSDDDAAICAAIIAMARELKLKVIAEGVANVEQLEFLRKHRCDQVQGYLISQPVPVADVERLLRAGPQAESEQRAAVNAAWMDVTT